MAMLKRLSLIIFLSTLFGLTANASCSGSSPTWSSTPDQASVQTCVNNASAGDTINVSAGSATWGSPTFNVNKAITLNGAGQGVTTIAIYGASGSVVITAQTTAPIRIQNFTFTLSGKYTPHPVNINGSWPGGKGVIFYSDDIILNNADFMTSFVPGGVIFSHIRFNGTYQACLLTVKDPSNTYGSWSMADTIGSRDTTGLYNAYIEDSSFVGGTITDCDDGCRIVGRHNTIWDGEAFNSHGYDTSPYGMRQFEIYSNDFHDRCTTSGGNYCICTQYSGWGGASTCTATGGTSQVLGNIGQQFWIRGATGVFYNNSMDNISNGGWGTKSQVQISGRAYGQPTLVGDTCGNIEAAYPLKHQPGMNYSPGSGDYVDPIYLWGNTGSWTLPEYDGFGWNDCTNPWSYFFQWGRNAVNQSLQGGSARPGYTAYTYPHSLAQGSSGSASSSGSATAPLPPTNLQAVVN